MTKYELARRKKQLQDLKIKYSQKRSHPVIKAYFTWLTMSLVDQEVMRKEWDSYYEACRNSISCRGYYAIRDAFFSEDTEKFNKIIQWHKKQREKDDFIPKPKGYDPAEFENNQILNNYLQMVQKIHDIEKEIKNETEILQDVEKFSREVVF